MNYGTDHISYRFWIIGLIVNVQNSAVWFSKGFVCVFSLRDWDVKKIFFKLFQ